LIEQCKVLGNLVYLQFVGLGLSYSLCLLSYSTFSFPWKNSAYYVTTLCFCFAC